ncbi:hypothetical protein [Streptomyces sp. NPDC055140]
MTLFLDDRAHDERVRRGEGQHFQLAVSVSQVDDRPGVALLDHLGRHAGDQSGEAYDDFGAAGGVSSGIVAARMGVRLRGGAVYVEGHQSQSIKVADGSVDRAVSIAHSPTVAASVGSGLMSPSWWWGSPARKEGSGRRVGAS